MSLPSRSGHPAPRALTALLAALTALLAALTALLAGLAAVPTVALASPLPAQAAPPPRPAEPARTGSAQPGGDRAGCFLDRRGRPVAASAAFSCLHGESAGPLRAGRATAPSRAAAATPAGASGCVDPTAPGPVRCPAWTTVYDDPTATHRSDQFPRDLAVSPDGRRAVLVSEDIDFDPAHPYDEASQWVALGYDVATGAEQWRTALPERGSYDAPQAVAFAPDGRRVYATGEQYVEGNPLSTPHDSLLTTAAYDAITGVVLWTSRLQAGPATDNGRAVAVTRNGRTVLVTGVTTRDGGDLDYLTAAFDADDGALRWQQRYAGLGQGGTNSPFAAALDPAGRLFYVTGWSAGTAEYDLDYGTVAYDVRTGAVAWTQRWDGTGQQLPDEAYGLAVSGDGRAVAVTGLSVGEDPAGKRTYAVGTVAYDARSGARLWSARYLGPGGSGFNAGSAIAADRRGDRFVVAAQVANPTTARDSDIGTLAYAARTGRQEWAADSGTPGYDGEFPLSVAVSADGGTAYVTGVSSSSAGGSVTGVGTGLGDQLTVGYATADGAQRWVGRFNATGYDDDLGFVAVSTSDGRMVLTATQERHGADPSGRGNVYDAAVVAYATDDSPAPALPEAPVGILLPVAAAAGIALVAMRRRRDGRPRRHPG